MADTDHRLTAGLCQQLLKGNVPVNGTFQIVKIESLMHMGIAASPIRHKVTISDGTARIPVVFSFILSDAILKGHLHVHDIVKLVDSQTFRYPGFLIVIIKHVSHPYSYDGVWGHPTDLSIDNADPCPLRPEDITVYPPSAPVLPVVRRPEGQANLPLVRPPPVHPPVLVGPPVLVRPPVPAHPPVPIPPVALLSHGPVHNPSLRHVEINQLSLGLTGWYIIARVIDKIIPHSMRSPATVILADYMSYAPLICFDEPERTALASCEIGKVYRLSRTSLHGEEKFNMGAKVQLRLHTMSSLYEARTFKYVTVL
ncbi:hypothetical protein CALVIDRAFT_560479 [Calocera viscosa TUFC12733]|uniref:Replication factor-A protein 1 N-terminal domain-containing protein n=1 Tax=Calocera viscosa (strain TUFC12733) TaxID=1330018 RepID=A0A167R381_CALVF|nr:hypothetical protein CALVIDRAFT_560479 [Calocera viscosa TUFC12733]